MEIHSFRYSNRLCWTSTVVGAMLSLLVLWGIFWVASHRHYFPESIYSNSYSLQLHLSILIPFILILSLRLWRPCLKVSMDGISTQSRMLIPWGRIRDVTLLKRNRCLLIETSDSRITLIPWPLNKPIAFQELCREFATPDNPLNIFLCACSHSELLRGGAPPSYIDTKWQNPKALWRKLDEK